MTLQILNEKLSKENQGNKGNPRDQPLAPFGANDSIREELLNETRYCEQNVTITGGDGIMECPECGYGISDLEDEPSADSAEGVTGQETRVEAAKGTGWGHDSLAKMKEISK